MSIANQEMSDEDLKILLEKARNKNNAKGITGMLLYRSGFFMQALEGEEDAIDQLFEVIKHDPRHSHAVQIYKNELTERAFRDWSMGFNQIDSDNVVALEGYTDFLQNPSPDYFINSPNKAKQILTLFKQNIFF